MIVRYSPPNLPWNLSVVVEIGDVRQVWANPNASSTPTLHFPPLGHPMARMTENVNLQRALLRRIEAAGEGVVEIREGCRVGEMQSGEGDQWVGLRVDENKWVRGAVVVRFTLLGHHNPLLASSFEVEQVGADGPNSIIRRYSDIESYGHPYPTHAVVATLHHQSSSLYPNHTAFQRFLPTGPLAFLPLSSTVSTMVWSTRPDLAAAYKKLAPEALTAVVNAGFSIQEDVLARLNERIKAEPLSAEEITLFLASNTPDSPFVSDPPALPPTITSIPLRSIASFPLRLSHAETYLGDRTVLVGDAAHTIHPLAGQGLNMGLADVRSLANVWETTRRTGGDFGARTGLLDYPRERYPANQLMLSMTDTLHHLFGSRLGPVNWLRGTGLDVLNEIGPIKKLLMGGAGASASSGADISTRVRNERDGQYDRADAGEGLGRRGRGWPMVAASGLEGWLGFKHVLGIAAGLAGEAAKNGLRRAADVLEKR